MGLLVCTGAQLMCPFGTAPSTLMVAKPHNVLVDTPNANIMDNKPIANILPFGLCTSIANPTVATATAAALGVLTPMPCIPNTPAPWAPGVPFILIENMPALEQNSKLMCMWGGVIQIIQPGQTRVLM